MVNLTIDGQQVSVEPGTTILKAARSIGIDIPTLCNYKDFTRRAAVVCAWSKWSEQEDLKLPRSTPAAEGMVVNTNTAGFEARRFVLKMLMSDHTFDCMTCYKYGCCDFVEFNANCIEYDAVKEFGTERVMTKPIDDSNLFYTYDPNKCVLCNRCIKVCEHFQCNHILAQCDRGYETNINPVFEIPRGKIRVRQLW